MADLDIGSRVYLDLRPGTIVDASPELSPGPGWWTIKLDDGTVASVAPLHPNLFPAERLAEACAHDLYWQMERLRSEANGGAGADGPPYRAATLLIACAMRTFAVLGEQERTARLNLLRLRASNGTPAIPPGECGDWK